MLANITIQLEARAGHGALHFFRPDGTTIALIELEGFPGAIYPTSETRPDGNGIGFVPMPGTEAAKTPVLELD